MNPSRGQCFRDAALYKFANAKRRILEIAREVSSAQAAATQHLGRKGFSRAKNLASRTKGGGAAHLTEFLLLTLFQNPRLRVLLRTTKRTKHTKEKPFSCVS